MKDEEDVNEEKVCTTCSCAAVLHPQTRKTQPRATQTGARL